MPFLRGETMAVTEWDLVEYGQRQRDYRRKRRYPILAIRWEGHSLTIDEVIENAKKYYPDLSIKPATVYKWVERELLPSPTIQSLGGTQGGTRAHYPTDAAAQMATAAAMMELDYKQKEIAQAREWVLNGIPLSPEMSKALAAFAGPNPPETLGLPENLEGAFSGRSNGGGLRGRLDRGRDRQAGAKDAPMPGNLCPATCGSPWWKACLLAHNRGQEGANPA